MPPERRPATAAFGTLLREWRRRRRFSQLDLALHAEISQRYVSLLETGQSNPSRAMVLRLAVTLEVPLRHRNRLLVAAGCAPIYAERPLERPDMATVRDTLSTIIRAHEPFPVIVLDGHWNILLANAAAHRIFTDVDPALLEPVPNMLRIGLHPNGLAPRIVNLSEVRTALLARVARQLRNTGDQRIAELYEELVSYEGAAGAPATEDGPANGPGADSENDLVLPIVLRRGDDLLRVFATITVFGTPLDITLDEVVIESYYPADEASARLLHAEARRASVPAEGSGGEQPADDGPERQDADQAQ